MNADGVYLDDFEPVHPCRELSTRHCPVAYRDVCGERPCARYELDPGDPAAVEAWGPEIEWVS